ncbi:MAG: site-2 protease family protein [Acidobacteria bacterium]|nr:site-2 protease family protein [Acidobacteriota bacterium]
MSLRRKLLHLLLFLLTILTTTGVGALWFFRDGDSLPRLLGQGMLYSFALVIILTAHEMGHYIACRWYGVAATPPYFIPMPLPPVGSFGAFIRIKSPIPHRKALFDIGIAGPLAGFVFIIPAALIAHYFAVPAPPVELTEGTIYFESPLLFRCFEWLFGLPELVELNPVMWAAWVGCLMTALNLLPVGQLDGGHVTYAVFGARGNRMIALACYLCVVGLAIYSIREGNWNWAIWVLILTFMLRVGR